MKHRSIVKQRGIVLLALAIATGLLTGCSGRGEAYETIKAAEVGEHIQQAANVSEMRRGDAERLQKLYRIEMSDVADFVLYTAISNVKADELAVPSHPLICLV